MEKTHFSSDLHELNLHKKYHSPYYLLTTSILTIFVIKFTMFSP